MRLAKLLNVETIGTIAVVLSLIFVAFEIRQNTDAVRSATIQAISEQSFESLAFFVENADLRASFVADQEGTATSDQSFQVRSFWAAQLRAQQNRFLQIKLGILDEETASQIRAAGETGDGGRARSFARHWETMKRNYPNDFVEYIEASIMSRSTETRE